MCQSAHSRTAKAPNLKRERRELRNYPEEELIESTKIYETRGLTPDLARQVAVQLKKHDALSAHMRDELNILEVTAARPVQAALASGVLFVVGESLPLIVALLAPRGRGITAIAVATIVSLACLGGLSTRVGGSGIVSGATRVVFWGALAMAASAAVGKVFGTKL